MALKLSSLLVRSKLFDRVCAPLLLVLGLSFWNFQTTGEAGFRAPVFFSLLVLFSLITGDWALVFLGRPMKESDSFLFRFLIGALIFNVVFFLVAIFSPLGLALDGLGLGAVFLVLWRFKSATRLQKLFSPQGISEPAFILLAFAAVSLWRQDLAHPISAIPGKPAIVKSWLDTFCHLSQLNVYARSHGPQSIFDFHGNGLPTHPYHLASYIFPSALMSIGAASALDAYASLWVPFGLLLSAFAAKALGSVAFGRWPGFAAGLGLLLSPDASQLGFGSPFLSYHWLQQVGPAGLYGTSCAAAAALFIIESVKKKSWKLAGAGYLFVGFTLVFKAHIFVAIALPLFIYPFAFAKGWSRLRRFVVSSLCLAVFAGVVVVSQKSMSVPTLRLDGSGFKFYSELITTYQQPGYFKKILERYVVDGALSRFARLFDFALILSFVTFGFWFLFYLAASFRLRKFGLATVLFPVIVVANYLAMSEGLAIDDRHIGMREELLHRPFVWAYFVICVFASAGIYAALFGDRKVGLKSLFPSSAWLGFKRHRAVGGSIGFGACCAGLVIPYYFGRNVQTMPIWNRGLTEVPACLAQAADFVRLNAKPDDLVEDSTEDFNCTFPGLANRQAFAIDSGGWREPPGLKERIEQMRRFKSLGGEEASRFAGENHVDWYLLRPADQARWADALSDKAVFRCEEYRLFRFSGAADKQESL